MGDSRKKMKFAMRTSIIFLTKLPLFILSSETDTAATTLPKYSSSCKDGFLQIEIPYANEHTNSWS